MTGKSKGRAHPTRIDRCSLVRGETNHHAGAKLETTIYAGGEYHPHVPANEVVIYVLSETSPTVLWLKLEELYMAKSLTNTLFL